VKLASFCQLLLLGLVGCGYHTVRGGHASSERLAIVLVTTNVTDAVASDEVVSGIREELSASGALETGTGYPRCEVEVLRADEASDGIAATRAQPDGPLLPSARATRIGIVARAWVVRSKDGPRERDTGDVRATDTVAVASDARAATFQQLDTLRATARRAGHRMGLRLLGQPAASD